jgi:hypothetical protein
MWHACRVLVGKPEKKKGQLEDLDTGRRIILKCILKKKGGAGQAGFIWLRIGTSGRLM